MTRKPRKNEVLIFSKLSRPRTIVMTDESSRFIICHPENGYGIKETELVAGHYLYNDIMYKIFGDIEHNVRERNQVIEHLIESIFWSDDK